MKTLTQSQLKGKRFLIFNFTFIIGVLCYLQSAILNPAYAKPPIHSANKVTPMPSPLSGCSSPVAMTDLDINNVRARMCTAGDMWWAFDKQIGQYEVPYNPHETTPGPMPIYAGAIWVGGMNSGNLYLAGQEYGHSIGQNDWWPGPLDTIGGAATISSDVCQQYDQHYKITQAEVAAFMGGGPITSAIANWPGNGNTAIGQANYLAPFFDKNGDGKYKPADGDYPGFDLINGDNACALNNCIPVDHLFGDECIWWVINDKGNIHTNTQGKPMGLEVHCQAFGFSTDDEINSMTFVNYRIYNRSSLELDSTYIGQWCDPDLGGATDDHVGCDVTRGLGYVYNETNNDGADGAELGYGVSPPACGIDFFRGPITNPAGVPGDGIDNNHNCVIDEPCEQAMMTHFTYFSNLGSSDPHSDPLLAKEYYNYLSGSWKDGSTVVYGGSGWAGSPGATTTPAAYVYPWNPSNSQNSDPFGWSVGGNCANHVAAPVSNWWDPLPGNPGQDDRRFVESAGPIKLLPGAVNVVTVGVVWARSSGGNLASINLMLAADDKAQKLFDNCFQVLNGPDAPDLTIQELDNKLILYISNKPTSNNYLENYKEYDPSISLTDKNGVALHCIDTTYHFEGYRIFQLKDGTVSSGDLFNADGSINTAKAHQIAQCDIKNGVSTIVNYVFNLTIGASIPMTEVQGADNGIFHSLVVTKDDFNGTPLVNHKTYFFMATAYGYNNFKTYKQDGLIDTLDNKCPFPANYSPAMDGQKKPYKQGRKNIQSYSAIPHTSTPYTGGTEMLGTYGEGPMITRVEGNGNAGMALDMVQSSVDQIFTNGNASGDWIVKTPTYLNGKGPLNIKVVDPLNVPDGNSFTLKFDTMPIIAYNSLVGAFRLGEKVTGATSHATGYISNNYSISTSSAVMYLQNIVGAFITGETITGFTSGATAKSIAKTIDNAAWVLTNNTSGEVIKSDKTIKLANEQLLLQYGLSVSIGQSLNPGGQKAPNGFIEASSSANKWLTGVAYNSASTYANWISAAALTSFDPDKVYTGILGGTWAPYALCASNSAPFDPTQYYTGPLYDATLGQTTVKDLASVDVVITSDKSKWTRCAVIEMCEDTSYTQFTSGLHARKFDIRNHASIDKNGNYATIGSGASTNPSDPNYISDKGMGWFPGYAINLETGERLNMAFGENSALSLRQGAIITYNVRDSITYGALTGGAFSTSPPEKITSYATPSYTVDATATIVSDNGSAMVIESVTGTSKPSDMIVGATSGAKANVSSFTAKTFTLGEQVTGTSGATGTIIANRSGSMNVTTITGTFVQGEIITGQASGTTAKISAYTTYNQDDNGADMKWNPTANSSGPAPWSTNLTTPVFGGQHYIYVFGHNKENTSIPDVPRYDAGFLINSVLSSANGQPIKPNKRDIFRNAMWVNIPLLVSGHSLLESDVTIRLRVTKPYRTGYSVATDTATAQANHNLPMYTFGTDDIATHINQNNLAVGALDIIGVVPNPYYAYSAYEQKNLDNIIKITNLPEQCTVSIYNLGGTLIRRIKKGEAVVNLTPKSSNSPTTWSDGSLDWDLKNTAGTPIASGVYIIHVEVPGVGEKVIKWFGIMRPIDLGSF